MSVIVQDENSNYIMYMKGAENEVLERCIKNDDYNHTVEAINMFSQEGLRTLVLAKKVIPTAEYKSWAQNYHKASVNIDNK